MERSRLITYAVGALLAIAGALVFWATKDMTQASPLLIASAGVLGYAKQHVADKSATSDQKLPPSSPNTPVVGILALVLGSLLFAGACSTAKPTPAEVGKVVIMCAETACDSTPPGPCERLISSAVACVASQGNAAVCLAGLPALIQVTRADVVCVMDALSIAHPDREIRAKAGEWMGAQNVTVIR